MRAEAAALAAAEGMRRSEEAARVRLRERQLQEQAAARVNAIKIHNQWRKIMRMAKVEELRGDIAILAQSHERAVDRKDAIIQVGFRVLRAFQSFETGFAAAEGREKLGLRVTAICHQQSSILSHGEFFCRGRVGGSFSSGT